MIREMLDIHQHVLWGMDDGAADARVMRSMLKDAHRQGIACVAATCHVRPGIEPFDLGLYRERLAEAQTFCREQQLQVQVIAGAEVAWTYQTVSSLRQHRIPTLGGTDYVLLELWRDISLNEARNAVRGLIGAGYCPVIAHVERYRCFRWMPRKVLCFREETGALFQISTGALLCPCDSVEKRFVRILLEEHGADAVATDAHGTAARPVDLLKARKWLAKNTDAAYARALTTFSGALR